MRKEESGLALGTAGLVLGIIAILYSIIVIGALAGIIGVIISIIHLADRMPYRKLGIWALIISLLGIAASAGFGIMYAVSINKSIEKMKESYSEGNQDYYGKPAPEISLTTIDGNEIKLSDLKGKRVLLDFWATWCPPCKKEIPELIKLRNATSPDEIIIIGISNESKKTISEFGRKVKINYPLVSAGLDANLPSPFGNVESIPTLFIIDANGNIENTVVGYHSYEELRKAAVEQKSSF